MSERPPDEATTDPSVASDDAEGRAYHVKLPMFEGPLDLLLHLIQKHELNILDIPIGFVALKYVEYIRMMEEMSIDLASEYLVMAATLAYIKSRSLLPPDPSQEAEEGAEEEEEDPRAELIRKLLEYQKYKHAADTLGQREVLGRDVFQRGFAPEQSDEEAPLAPMSLFKLVDAFESVLKRVKQVQEHQIDFEKVSISDRIGQIVERLRSVRTLQFEQLFDGDVTRSEMIVTFLALLEMTKLRMTRLKQEGPLAPIVIELVLSAEQAQNFDAERAFEQMHHAVEQDFAADKPWSEQEPDPAALDPSPWEANAEDLELTEEELAEELRVAAEAFALGEREMPDLLGDEDESGVAGQLSTFGPPDDDDFPDDSEPALVADAGAVTAHNPGAGPDVEVARVPAPVGAGPSQDEVARPSSEEADSSGGGVGSGGVDPGPTLSAGVGGPDDTAAGAGEPGTHPPTDVATWPVEPEVFESESAHDVRLEREARVDSHVEVTVAESAQLEVVVFEGDLGSAEAPSIEQGGSELPAPTIVEAAAESEWVTERDTELDFEEPREHSQPDVAPPVTEPETEDQDIAAEEGSQDPKGSDVESR